MQNQRTVDLSGGNEHIREIANEMGVDYIESHSSIIKSTVNGVEIESWYNENRTVWEAFAKGYGTFSSWYSREDAVWDLMEKIQCTK